MASDKVLPRKLEEDLANAKYYKPSAVNVESGAQRIAKVFDDSKERAMYDEILGPMLGNNKTILSKAPTPSNTDFNTTIIARLKHVENEAKDARQKLAEQIITNEKLRDENDLLKSMVGGSTGALDEVAKLKQQNQNLHSKIREMEAFLGDYGLVWVGSKAHEDESELENTANNEISDASDCAKAPAHTVSYSDFNFHIDELNAVIYSEPAQIVIEGSNQRKARLVQSSELLETVRVVYYRNGLMIKRGPFRQCGSPGYKSFVKDIVDGYFPSEFQGEYPEGVVFSLKDQRHVDFVEGKSDSYAENSQMSRAQLLNRLPKTVIHKGEVVGMRADIENLLGGGKGADSSTAGGATSQVVAPKPKVVIETPAINASETHNASMGELVQIQVKWVDQSTFIAKLYEHNTVGDLKSYIVQHFQGQATGAPDNSSGSNTLGKAPQAQESSSDSKRENTSTMTDSSGGDGCTSLVGALGFDFELRSAYPPRALGLFLSLKEAGLSPNGTVHARKLEYSY